MPHTTFWRRITRRPDASSVPLPRTVDAVHALELVAAGANLVDVRTHDEWRSGHAKGAVHVPLDRLEARTDRLDPGAPLVVMCRSGARSEVAARALRQVGFEATSLRGGVDAWQRAGGPTVTGA